jgi:hypothetical protein
MPVVEDFRSTYPPEEWFPFFGSCSLLYNDTDEDGDPLTWEIVDQPAHGQFMKIDEEWSAYRPDPDYSTEPGWIPGGSWDFDTVTYRAFDGQDYSQPATMRLWVAPINDAPSFTPGDDVVVNANSGAYSAAWATAISAGPPSESWQTVDFELDVPANGVPDLFSVPPAIDSDGTLTFTPAPDQVGLVEVNVRAKDDGGLEDWDAGPNLSSPPDDTSDIAVFQIVVVPEDVMAVGDLLTVAKDAGPTSVDVLANDTALPGHALTVVGKTNGAHGTVAITGGGTGLTYDPAQSFVGIDAFSYTASDGQGGSDSATVTVTVVGDTTPPSVVAPAQRFLGQTVAGTLKTRITWSATDTGSGIKAYTPQQSTNGGTWTTIPLVASTRTFVDRSLTDGVAYRFRVRATDGEGNISPWQYSSVFKPARFQEGTALATYLGTWGTWKSASHLGGAARYAGTFGKRVSFKTSAYDIGLVWARTTTSGSADIYVDGVFASRVNLRATATMYRQLIFTRHWPTLTSHTIEIRPIGTGRVDIDAFVVLR